MSAYRVSLQCSRCRTDFVRGFCISMQRSGTLGVRREPTGPMRLLIAALSLAFVPVAANAAPKKKGTSKAKTSKQATKTVARPPVHATCTAKRPRRHELAFTPSVFSGPAGVPEFTSVHVELTSEVRGWAEILQGYVEFREPGSQGRRWRHHIRQIERAVTPSDCVFREDTQSLSFDMGLPAADVSKKFDKTAGTGRLRCQTREGGKADGKFLPACSLHWQAREVSMRHRPEGVCESDVLEIPATTHTVIVDVKESEPPLPRPRVALSGAPFEDAEADGRFGWSWRVFAQPQAPRRGRAKVFKSSVKAPLWTADVTPGCTLEGLEPGPQVASWIPKKNIKKHSVVEPRTLDDSIDDLTCGWTTTAREDHFSCHVSHEAFILDLRPISGSAQVPWAR